MKLEHGKETYEQISHQRVYIDGKQTHEEINIFNQ